jgi:hypothetical protein
VAAQRHELFHLARRFARAVGLAMEADCRLDRLLEAASVISRNQARSMRIASAALPASCSPISSAFGSTFSRGTRW